MWATLSRDVLLYEILPYCDPKQVATLLKLNRNTNRIVKEFSKYKTHSDWWKEIKKQNQRLKKKKRVVFDREIYQLNNLKNSCERGDLIWAKYYHKHAPKVSPKEITHAAFIGGNIQLIKYFLAKTKQADRYHFASHGLVVAIANNYDMITRYILDTYGTPLQVQNKKQTGVIKLNYAQAINYAAKLGEQSLVAEMFDRMKTNYCQHSMNIAITAAFIGAAFGNQLDILKYIVNRIELLAPPETLVIALREGHDEMAEYIASNAENAGFFELTIMLIFDNIHENDEDGEEMGDGEGGESESTPEEIELARSCLIKLKALSRRLPPDPQIWTELSEGFLMQEMEKEAMLCYEMSNLDPELGIHTGIVFNNKSLINEILAKPQPHQNQNHDWEQYLMWAAEELNFELVRFFAQRGARSFNKVLRQCRDILIDDDFHNLKRTILKLKKEYKIKDSTPCKN
jgi:hypothetical protein